MTTKLHSMHRFESMNEIVDTLLASMNNAEIALLWVYFRHAKMRRSGTYYRNVFSVSDGRAAKILGKSRQVIRKQRLAMIDAGVISQLPVNSRGRSMYIIGNVPIQGGNLSEPNRQYR